MALGIRTKVFFFTLLATLLTFLVAQGILTRPLEPAMSRDALATLQGRVPLVGIATALVLATLLAWQVGRGVICFGTYPLAGT